VSLPNPLPDNPLRWDGWRNYNSENLYDRLGLDFDPMPSVEQIEENCRILLVWWQKKLPLKNQPSNPMTQLLRVGMDEAPQYLAEARTKLLDPEVRAAFDAELRVRLVEGAVVEFKKVIEFAINNGELTAEAEERLYESGAKLGLLRAEMCRVLDAELERFGAKRVATPAPAPAPVAPAGAAVVAPAVQFVSGDPFSEFRRVLRLSKLCLEGDDMTDDQRDALCNMGESLGLTGGQAEDLIDEYLEEMAITPMQPVAPVKGRPGAATAVARHPVAASPAKTGGGATVAAAKPAVAAKAPAKATAPAPPAKKDSAVIPAPRINLSPVARIQERAKYPNFVNFVGGEMLLVPSGIFQQGSVARDASPHEQPVSATTIGCFYIGRFPITNAQYEKFDSSHSRKRTPTADDSHPVVYVNSVQATAFCNWLSTKEGRKYRLPTEAEWEYAARGPENRIYPWGDRLDAGHFANFADRRTSFAWRDPNIDDGFAETAPVGSYPRGASPFGVEDMSGNVYEWCLDFFDFYKGGARTNPRGPSAGQKRVYRGGSWKSRASSLRTTARGFNTPDYASNDLGFRVVCECE
jgi:formylglycine-generating enzyme required for sulfatase activity